ncbi:MAG: DUF2304 domain-containing protein [Clostridiales bacterium]|jgi:hypothetical protein|nr:DUF2304 domain-containing protein [Clostridiales bacterium]
MTLKLQLLVGVVVVIIFLFLLNLLRKRNIELKYCLVWLIGLISLAVIDLFPGLLYALAGLLGIETPVNALFAICIVFLALVCVSLTVVVSRLSDRLRKLVQNIAIKEKEMADELRQKLGESDGGGGV